MKPVILFVDDEPNILNALKRFTRPKRQEWDMYFFDGGAEALEFIRTHLVDVIVSDMRMPGVDGATLLEFISQHAPGVIRIILSGEAEIEQTYRAVGRSHRFLAKPCEPESLIAAIEAPLMMRNDVGISRSSQTSSLLDRIQTPQENYEMLEQKIADQSVSTSEIADVISNDPGLAARLLQLVNSAYFGRPLKTCNIQRAIDHIGLDRLREILKRRRFGNNGDAYQPSASALEKLEFARLLAERAASHAVAKQATSDVIDATYTTALLSALGIDSMTRDIRSTQLMSVAAPSAAYAAALLGLPERVTDALKTLSMLTADPDDIEYRARLVSDIVLDYAQNGGSTHATENARSAG